MDVSDSVVRAVSVDTLEAMLEALVVRLPPTQLGVRAFASRHPSVCAHGEVCDSDRFSNIAYSMGFSSAVWDAVLAGARDVWSTQSGRRKYVIAITDSWDNASHPDSLVSLVHDLRAHPDTTILLVGVGHVANDKVNALFDQTGAQVIDIRGLGMGTDQFAQQVADYIGGATSSHYRAHATLACKDEAPATVSVIGVGRGLQRTAPSVRDLKGCGPQAYVSPVEVATFKHDKRDLTKAEQDSQDVVDQIDRMLDAYEQLLPSNPNLEFIIRGYTDETGSMQHNVGLSSRRAHTIEKLIHARAKKRKLYLERKTATNAGQIVLEGLGESRKFSTARENHRVELALCGLSTTPQLPAHCH